MPGPSLATHRSDARPAGALSGAVRRASQGEQAMAHRLQRILGLAKGWDGGRLGSLGVMKTEPPISSWQFG